MKAKFALVVIVIAVIISILLAGCAGPKVGDTVVAKQQIQLTDEVQETCILPKGATVLINRVDYRSYGSTMTQKIYLVESVDYASCWGFALAEYFK